VDQLSEKCSATFTAEQMDMLQKAIEFTKKAHEGQKRDSGDPYFTHPYAVAIILADLGMDSDTIMAGLMHDVLEDNLNIRPEEIEKQFNTHIAELVEGVTKLTKTTFQSYDTKERQAENVRKMFFAMAKDIRVIIIKLCDRLHNMRTLEYCRTEKRVKKARETLEIYAPLAHRLGMGAIKCELEDLAFMHIDPEEFYSLSAKVAIQQNEREQTLNMVMDEIRARLDEMGIPCEIHGRPKHLYSIYKKMKNQSKSFEDLYDLVAIRVIVNTVKECYAILGVIHTMWKPLPGRFKDYIAVPKPNMYQSLHTTLLGENGLPFEVQIRTFDMHSTAEFGIAAHWKYKEGRSDSNDLDDKLAWLRRLMDWQSDVNDANEFMETLKMDFFSDYVFVFTPRGEVFDLASGATPIDFAYRVHTAVGNRCVGAKANGKIVPLAYELKTGDIVEIITSPNSPGPSMDWLKLAKTQQAKSKIRQWFKRENKEEMIEKGRDMLQLAAKRVGQPLSKLMRPEWLDPIIKRLKYSSVDDIYASIGYGGITTGQIIPKLLEEYKKESREERLKEQLEEKQQQPARVHKSNSHGVIVKGIDDMLVRFAKCCTPVPGDDIIGYVTRGRGVSVHRKDCPNMLSETVEPERLMEATWAIDEKSSYMVSIMIVADERPGLLMEISQVFLGLAISLTSINAKTDRHGTATIQLMFEIKDTAQLNSVLKQIKRIHGVTEAYRINA
jgi:GTP pyrophosphokinase